MTFNVLKKKNFIIPLLLASVYWIPASVSLVGIINGTVNIFPQWLDATLFPGYFLGFILGFFGGNFLAFVGQLITLFVLFVWVRVMYNAFFRNEQGDDANIT